VTEYCTIAVTQLTGAVAPKLATKGKVLGGWSWRFESAQLLHQVVVLTMDEQQTAVEAIEVPRVTGLSLDNLRLSKFGAPTRTTRAAGRRVSTWRFQLDPCRAQVELDAFTADVDGNPPVERLRWHGVKPKRGSELAPSLTPHPKVTPMGEGT
jgi:hypothetical protein